VGLLIAELAVNRVLLGRARPLGPGPAHQVAAAFTAAPNEWDWAAAEHGRHAVFALALVTGAFIAVGLQKVQLGAVPIAFVVAMIVVYDATGVRPTPGDHARVINLMMDELLTAIHWPRGAQGSVGPYPARVLGGILSGMLMAYLIVKGI